MPLKGADVLFDDLERQVYEVAHKRALKGMRRQLGYARSRWPVGRPQGRPHSRDLFELRDTSDGRRKVHISLYNTATDALGTPYAFYVRSSKVPGAGKRNAWTVLVRRPVLALVKELAVLTARDPKGARNG